VLRTFLNRTVSVYDRLDVGVEELAAAYAAGYKICHRVVISAGFRSKLARSGSQRRPDTAYGSLLDLRNRHPIDGDIKGARELFPRLAALRWLSTITKPDSLVVRWIAGLSDHGVQPAAHCGAGRSERVA
jgi:hypothetical protein